MVQSTYVTIPEELEREIRDYLASCGEELTLPDLVSDALRQYLALRTLEAESVFQPKRRMLHVTRAVPGSGLADVSERHDDYLADKLPE